jgi:hypothetical protein
MSEHPDATEDRPDDDAPLDPRDDDEEGADEEPQPWAKALPGDS